MSAAPDLPDFGIDAPTPRKVEAEVIEQPCERCGAPVPTMIRYAGRVWGRKGRSDQAVSCSASCRTMLSRSRKADFESNRARYEDKPMHYARLGYNEIKASRRERECGGKCGSLIYIGEPATRVAETIDGRMVTKYLCRFCG